MTRRPSPAGIAAWIGEAGEVVGVAGETGEAGESRTRVACWGDNRGRQASPRGSLYSDEAVRVGESRISWLDEP